MENERTYTAFAEHRRVAGGPLATALVKVKALFDRGTSESILIFEDDTGKQVDFDFRGTADEVVARARPALPQAGPGRPKLGVVSREISLLPRHWEWLETQPHGISAAIRRLVEEARKRDPQQDNARLAIESASRVMTAMAGNRRGFEEASRALFARDRSRFDRLIQRWPADIRKHLQWLVREAMPATANAVPSATVPTRRLRSTAKKK